MKKLLLLAVLTLLIDLRAAAAEQNWRDTFLEEQRALANCEDVACFRQWMRQFGSKNNIADFERTPDSKLQKIFQAERDVARLEVANPADVEVEARPQGIRMAVVIHSREKLGYKPEDFMSRRLYVEEDGIWKIGHQ